MNKNNYQVTVDRALEGKTPEVLIIPGHKMEALRLQAQPGAVYTLSDKANDKAPQQIFGRRQGKHLHLQLDVERRGEAADLILENFYEVASGTVVGMAEDASTYRFIPKTAQEFDQLNLLADGGSASLVLGGAIFVANSAAPLVVAAAPLMVAAAPLIAAGGLAMGPAGMAAAGLLGVAALAGGGGGGGETAAKSSAQLPLFGVAIVDSDDTGAKGDGITQNIRPKLTGMAQPNSRVYLNVGKAAPVEVQADETGQWVWAPDADLADDVYPVTVNGIDAKGISNSGTLKLTIDTQKISAVLSSNLSALESGVAGKVDNILNLRESQAGFTHKIVLSEKPSRPLTAADFTLDGKALPATSVVSRLSDTEYTVTALPAAGSKGTQTLAWSDAGKTLTDLAANGWAASSKMDSLSTVYDLRVPDLVVTNPAGSGKPLETKSGELKIDFVKSGGVLDNSISKMSLLGKDLGGVALTSSVTVPENTMSKLSDGFYSLVFDLEDQVGNKSTTFQILEVDRAGVIADAWIPGQSNQPGDSAKRDYFVDRPGSQELIAQGLPADDVFFWLRANAGTSGTTSTDTVKNFYLGQSSGTKGVIDIKDLLSRSSDTDLAKYLQVKQVDKDNNSVIDETRLYINFKGGLAPSTSSSLNELAATSTQIIILEGLNKTFNELVGNGNLIWQSPVI